MLYVSYSSLKLSSGAKPYTDIPTTRLSIHTLIASSFHNYEWEEDRHTLSPAYVKKHNSLIVCILLMSIKW